MRLLSACRRPNPSPIHIYRREEGTNRKRGLPLPTLTYLLIAARLSYSSQGIRTELSRWSTPAGPARPQHGPVSPVCVAGVADTVGFVYLWPAGAWFRRFALEGYRPRPILSGIRIPGFQLPSKITLPQTELPEIFAVVQKVMRNKWLIGSVGRLTDCLATASSRVYIPPRAYRQAYSLREEHRVAAPRGESAVARVAPGMFSPLPWETRHAHRREVGRCESVSV